MDELTIRPATPSDRPHLRAAVVELQEHESRLHETSLPGEAIADAYLAWMLGEAAKGGAAFVAEVDGAFAGFVAGWIVDEDNIAQTADSMPRCSAMISWTCASSGGEPWRSARSRSISRRRRSSPSSFSSDQSLSYGRASRPAAQSGLCSISRRKPLDEFAPMAQMKKSASTRSWSGIDCVSVRARRRRSMAN
jgi:hypothetical protein